MSGAVAGRVVVRQHPHRPGAGRRQDGFGLGDPLGPMLRVPRRPQEGEVEDQVQLVAGAVVRRQLGRRSQVHLADHDPVARVAVEHGPDAAQERVDPWVVVHAGQVALGQRRRLVGQRWILGDEVDHVGPEAVDPPVEPEPQHPVHGFDHLGLGPVQVGLLGQEQVQVPLPGVVVPRPRPAAEGRPPVVGPSLVAPVPPEVPVAPRRAAGGP